jgi:hypothetical protein
VLRPAVLWPAAILLIAAVGGGAYLGYEAKSVTASNAVGGTGTKTTPAAAASTAQGTPTAAPSTAAATPSPTVAASSTVAASATTAASPTVTATATAAAAGGAGTGAQPSGIQSNPAGVSYLFAIAPIEGNVTPGPVQMGTTDYQSSIKLFCYNSASSVVYDVAGFKFLNATIGVPNDSPNATGNSTTITFFKNGSTTQLGQPITSALGQQQRIHLNLQGSDQLEVDCTSTTGNGMYAALGNAEIGPS